MPKHSEKRKKDEDDETQLNQVESDLEVDEEESWDDESVENEEMELIETEFEAYPPLPEDKEGIKALLKQQFKKETIELGLLTEHLINEKKLCIVVKQLVDEQIDEEDEDVFSLSTFIQLNKKELINKPFIKLINKFLIRTAKENGNDEIVKLLENQNKVLVLNERFINLPPKLGIMSLQSLLDEAKNQNLKTDYFILICKLLKTKDESSVKKDKNKKSKVSTDENELMYLNAEDEIFSENAIHKYEFKIADDNSDITVNQNWKSGQQYVPFRRVLLLDQNGFNNSLKQLKEEELKTDEAYE